MDAKQIPKKLLRALGAIIVALLVFQAGVFVGFHKAGFARHFRERWPDSHGAFGQIAQIVRAATSTPVAADGQEIKASDLRPGEILIVLGLPDEHGEINAKFIRLIGTTTPK